MKHVVSVSLGSSSRNHRVEAAILGETFLIERIGTDGDMQKAIEMIASLDGKVDAIGLGGIDLYIHGGGRRYRIRGAVPLATAAKKTPVVDGSGLKNTLERKVVEHLHRKLGVLRQGQQVLMVCAADRPGMAEALAVAGCHILYGDLVFALGLPIPIRSARTFARLARLIAPVASRLPFEVLYPTGSKQTEIRSRHSRYYDEAEVVAGDFHYIRRHLPDRLDGKIILTNTVTEADVRLLGERGARALVTTTPEFDGRSFGTNVLEGVMVALLGKAPEDITPRDYEELLERGRFQPRVVWFDPIQKAQ